MQRWAEYTFGELSTVQRGVVEGREWLVPSMGSGEEPP